MAFDLREQFQARAIHGVFMAEYTITYDEISAAATTATEDIFTLPIGYAIVGVGHHINTNFDGGATSELTMAIGITGGDTDRFYTAVSVHEDATEIPDKFEVKATTGLVSKTATQLVTALFTATGANTDALTAGSVTLYFLIAETNTDVQTKGA